MDSSLFIQNAYTLLIWNNDNSSQPFARYSEGKSLTTQNTGFPYRIKDLNYFLSSVLIASIWIEFSETFSCTLMLPRCKVTYILMNTYILIFRKLSDTVDLHLLHRHQITGFRFVYCVYLFISYYYFSGRIFRCRFQIYNRLMTIMRTFRVTKIMY